MTSFVIDTNVAVVANGRDTHASNGCQLRCIEKPEQIIKGCKIVIDDEGHIFGEYEKNLNFRGEPGIGDAFYQHVFNHQGNPEIVLKITVHSTVDGSFEEFPNDLMLDGFDNDDHKFVAVALTCDDNPKILNAVDSDWANFHPALTNHGLIIEYLCPEHVTPDPEDLING